MFNKKIMVLTIFIVSILAVSAVSAAENTDGYQDVPVANEVGAQQVVAASGDEVNLTASEEANDTLQYIADDFITLYSDVWSEDDPVCGMRDPGKLNGYLTINLTGAKGSHELAMLFDKTNYSSYNITYKGLQDTIHLTGQCDIKVIYNRVNDGKVYEKTGKINLFEKHTESNTFTALFKIIEQNTAVNLDYDYTFSQDKDFDLIEGVLINKAITINGNGHTIDGNNLARAFAITFADSVTLENIKFINCYSPNGGGAIYALGSDVSLIDASFTNSAGAHDGSIHADGCNIVIDHSTFEGSSSDYAPAIFVSQGNLTIKNTTFKNLNAGISAGAVAVRFFDNLIIEGSAFENIRSTKNGGAILIDASDEMGGGGNSLIRDVSFVNTSGDFGGAFMQLGGNLNMQNLTFASCTSDYDGGAAYLSGLNATIANSQFISNKVTLYDDYLTFGGALYVDNANLTITNSKFTDNSAYEGSGAIGIYDSFYKIINTQFNNGGEAIFTVFKREGSEIVNLIGKDTVSDNNVFYPYVISGVGRDLTLTGNEIDDSLPSCYDLRDYDLTSPVKDQGIRGSCWAVSGTGTLESALLKMAGLTTILSANNMQNAMIKYSKYGLNYMDEAGYNTLGMAYLLSWLGAFPQEYDTFDEIGKISPIIYTTENIHVQDIVVLPKDNNGHGDPSIKWAILEYGELSGDIYGIAGDGESQFYSEEHFSQYYPKEHKGDHVVSIVGWDDSFPKENFNTPPPGDGAWIIRNSWGESFGDGGYFYVSYYDKTLCPSDGDAVYCAIAIVLNNTVPYNRNYQYDFVGLNDFANYTDGSYMNKYVSVDDDYIAAVGTYFNQSGVDYEVRIEVNGQNVHTQNGVSPYYGYHTIKLNDYVPIKKGDEFSVIISSNAFPFSGLARTYYNKGVSFALCDGEWIDVYDEWDMTACIKVYTIDEIPKEKQNTTIAAAFESANYALTVKLTNGDSGIPDADIAVNVAGHVYSAKTDHAGQATVSVADLAPGTYTAEISYAGDDTFNPSKALLDISLKADTVISLVYDSTARVLVATLINNATGDSVKGANVVFTIKTKSYNVKTDLNGRAELSTLNLALGENTATATYKGNSKYNPSTTTINFTNKVNTALSAVYDDAAEEVVVTLINNDTGSPLSGRTITVKLAGKTYKDKTDANGQYRVSTANLAPGTYTATASYSGTTKYTPSQTTLKVPLQTATSLSALYNANTYQIIATLTDNATGQAIGGGNIIFEVNGVTYTAKTNSLGQAKVSTKDWAYGTYTANVNYEGNSKYTASSASTTFTVKIATIISAAYDAEDMEIIATLINDVTLQPILGATVTIKINKVTYKVSTDNSGQARLSVADFPLGTYDATVSYGGNSKYNPVSASLSVPVKANTSLDAVYKADAKQFVAALTNLVSGKAISGVNVAIQLNGASYTIKTNSAGQAIVSTKGLASGVYPASVSFAGNSMYYSSNTSMDVLIDVNTKVSALYKDGILTATLTDKATCKGINGAELLVSFGDVKYTVKTNSDGQTTVSTRDLPSGPYTAVVSFDGNGGSPSSTSLAIDVKTDGFFIVEDISIEYGTDVELTAKLVNYATGKGIVGATVGFKFNGKSYSAKTDSSGQATVTITGLNPGNYETTVTYNGNSKYNPAKATFNALVNKITTSFELYYDSETNEVVATLINGATGKGVYGGTVGIFLNNVKNIIVTDKNGQARLSLGNVDPTTFTAYASYAGNTKYFATGRTITPVENKVISCISAEYNKKSDEVVATLINTETDKPIVGGTVSVVVNNVRNTLKTDSNGQAKVSLADKVPNVYVVVSSYSGNSKYTATTETRSIVKI